MTFDATGSQQTPVVAAKDLATLGPFNQLPGLVRQLTTLRACSGPVRLDGHRSEVDTATGLILRHLDSGKMPAGCLLVRCGNRPATRCASCAEVYRQDTFQLITAGLRGGKTVPDTIARHPRVFATLTARSFGPVHNRPTGPSGSTRRCRCGRSHAEDVPATRPHTLPRRHPPRRAQRQHRPPARLSHGRPAHRRHPRRRRSHARTSQDPNSAAARRRSRSAASSTYGPSGPPISTTVARSPSGPSPPTSPSTPPKEPKEPPEPSTAAYA